MSFDLKLVNNDLKLGIDGKVQTVTGTPKLRQDIIKVVVTPLGSVRAHPWYGCAIDDSIIGQIMPENLLVTEVAQSISDSLIRLKHLQSSQSATQEVSMSEMIHSVQDVAVERDLEDQRLINIIIIVVTRRLEKLEELFTIIS